MRLGSVAQGRPAEGDPAEGDPAEGDPAEGDPAEGDPAEGGRPAARGRTRAGNLLCRRGLPVLSFPPVWSRVLWRLRPLGPPGCGPGVPGDPGRIL